jgi:hypothetical protein
MSKSPVPEPAYIPTAYLLCRNQRHQWEPVAVVVSSQGNGTKAYEGTFRCRRCKMPKVEVVDPDTGERITATRYEYPKGYLLHGITDRKTWNSEVRQEAFWRLAYNQGPKKRKGKTQ